TYSPDGQHIASGWGSILKILDAKTGQCLCTAPERSPIRNVSFFPNADWILCSHKTGQVTIWDWRKKQYILQVQGHDAGAWGAVVHPDGQSFATSGSDRTIKLWNVESGKVSKTLKGHTGSVYSVAYSPDGKRLVSSGLDFLVRLWDPETGKLIRTFKHDFHAGRVTFSPDGKRIAASNGNDVKIWDLESGENVLTLRGHRSTVVGIDYRNDGRLIVTSSSGNDKTVKLWNASNGKLLQTMRGHRDVVRDVAFHPDGNQVGSASYDSTLKLWDVSSVTEPQKSNSAE
ncbi:MAG: WD40 repeat domain-containing protein, partial [Planctomycetaceae bacterium]|nr:WD40 repeat domain-containing protein [Planctomycetaceae bacterium]